VTLRGTNLSGVSVVIFNGVPATALTVLSNTSLRAIVPAQATTGPVAVVNRAGVGQSPGVFRVAPKITGFTPPSGIAGETITVTGFNLAAGSAAPVVQVGAVSVAPTASPTAITFAIPATVRTPDGTATSATNLVVIRPPTVRGASPAAGAVGAVVTVRGVNLMGATGVTFNGVPATGVTSVSATALRATIPAGATTGPIRVTNRAGSGQSPARFRVLPRITGFAPTSAVPGETVILTGFNLRAGAAMPIVRVGTAVAAVVESTTGSATFTVPPKARKGRVSISTPDGRSVSATDLLVLIPTQPKPQAFEPAAAAVGSTIVISGSGLSRSSEVTFAGPATAATTAAMATSVRVVVPAGARTGQVVVKNPMGSGTSTTAFTVLPRIAGFTPGGGLAGDAITIVGTSLQVVGQRPTVRIGGVSAPVEASAPDTVVARIPNGATTGRITVTTADGTAMSTNDLVVTAPAVVEARLEKTTTRSGTTVERVVEVRFHPRPGDFHSATVSDGVLFFDTPLALHGQFNPGGPIAEDFSVRRVLGTSESYPPPDRQFTVVATPAAGGPPLVFRATPRTLGASEHITIVEIESARVSATPHILTSVVAGDSTVVGVVDEPDGTAVELFGCRGVPCSFVPFGVGTVTGPFWSINVPVTLAAGDRLVARATAAGKFPGLNSSAVTVLAPGQLPAPTVFEPMPGGATAVYGFVESGSSVEVFVQAPVEASLGFAAVEGTTWVLDGVAALAPGQAVFAIARRPAFDASPRSEVVVAAAPAPVARFDFDVVAGARLQVAWDVAGITAPLALLRVSADVANADATLVCHGEVDVDGQVPPLPESFQVTLPLLCAGTTTAQPAASGRVCVAAIDAVGRQTSHCIAFD
jgi:hypothetical protein